MTERKALILEDSFVTVPLGAEPQRALEALCIANSKAVDKALARFGLTANEIRMPTFERMVYEGETRAIRRPSDVGNAS